MIGNMDIGKNSYLEKVKSVVIGHAIADALGVPVEFMERYELDDEPVKEMLEYGTYPLPKGSWSDDTSMSLGALEVLGKYGNDYDRIMGNFGKWYYEDEFTPTGEMFDVGNTCSSAIERFFKLKFSYRDCGLSDERSNGNGSLMRIHPHVLYLYSQTDMSLKEKIGHIEMASALTHAHPRSKLGCGIYSFVLWELLDSPIMDSVRIGLDKALRYYKDNNELKYYNRLFDRTFIITKRCHIKSSGYIVDTLEAAIWCLLTTSNYDDCVLKAVNLGDDTDTVAAIAGGLAGALYGYDSIPDIWKKNLLKFDYIVGLCEQLVK